MALCVLEFYCVQIYAIFSKPPSRINIFFDNICRDYFSFSRYFPDRQAGMYGSYITEKRHSRQYPRQCLFYHVPDATGY